MNTKPDVYPHDPARWEQAWSIAAEVLNEEPEVCAGWRHGALQALTEFADWILAEFADERDENGQPAVSDMAAIGCRRMIIDLQTNPQLRADYGITG